MSKYKAKKEFIVEKINNKITIFDSSTSTFFSLNETGSIILNLVKRGKGVKEITIHLVKKFQISFDLAQKDVEYFLKKLKKNKIIV